MQYRVHTEISLWLSTIFLDKPTLLSTLTLTISLNAKHKFNAKY